MGTSSAPTPCRWPRTWKARRPRRARTATWKRGALLRSSTLASDLRAVRARAAAWQRRFAAPILDRSDEHRRSPVERNLAGKPEFDAIRVPLSQLRADLALRLAGARRKLTSDANFLQVVLLVAAGLILGSVLAAGLPAAAHHHATAGANSGAKPAGRGAASSPDPSSRQRRRARDRRARATRSTRCAGESCDELATVEAARAALRGAGARADTALTPSSSSSPTSPRTTCRSRCARSRASARRLSAATTASSTSAPTSTSTSPSTAPSGCRS